MRRGLRVLTAALAVVAVIGTTAVAVADTPTKKKATKLVGTFKIEGADCAAGAPAAGSYFRMLQSGGTLEAGPFLANGDSPCVDTTYTPLLPGADGGLRTGKFQPDPDPAFDATGNGLADAITSPTKFFGVDFAVSTNKTDPESGATDKAPAITAKGKKLRGNVEAVSVAYGGQQFNQGAPKPDGSLPGSTKVLSGTYDSKTGAYTVDWSSQIIGGPFDGFAGVWHLEGTFARSK